VTRLLYYDSVEGEYQREFRARVVASGEGWVALDQTAFHVEGGGQATDVGMLGFPGGEAKVLAVKQDEGVVKHFIEGASPAVGSEVQGAIDWQRRFELMRGHTSGHLMAKAVWALLNAKCVGNSIDVGKLRIDVRPARLGPPELKRIEDEVNQAIARDKQVRIRQLDRARLQEGEPGERDLLALSPPGAVLRAIEVQDYDLCPCSGTHVAGTREIGGVKLLKRESKGQQTDRISYQLVASPEP
jgi:misacylated tRNA(Ala) deacylase